MQDENQILYSNGVSSVWTQVGKNEVCLELDLVKEWSKLKSPVPQLVKAFAVKKWDSSPPTILDGTMGLAKDSLKLLALGAKVIGVEQQSLVFQLVKNNLDQILKSHHQDPWSRFEVIHQDTKKYLESLSEESFPDYIYLDPMFPFDSRKRLPKKDLVALQQILGPEVGIGTGLLKLALLKAKKRVIVKRHPKSPYLDGVKPTAEFSSKLIRYDMYSLVR